MGLVFSFLNMEGVVDKKWGFEGNKELSSASVSVRGVLNKLVENIDVNNPHDQRPVITLARTDPSVFPCFRTTSSAVDAVADAVRSFQFNGYPPTVGVASAKKYVGLKFLS